MDPRCAEADDVVRPLVKAKLHERVRRDPGGLKRAGWRHRNQLLLVAIRGDIDLSNTAIASAPGDRCPTGPARAWQNGRIREDERWAFRDRVRPTEVRLQ